MNSGWRGIVPAYELVDLGKLTPLPFLDRVNYFFYTKADIIDEMPEALTNDL